MTHTPLEQTAPAEWAARSAPLRRAPAELASAEPGVLHYEATPQRVCPSLRQRLARFLHYLSTRTVFRRGDARIGPVAGEGTGCRGGGSARSAESSIPPRQARRGLTSRGGGQSVEFAYKPSLRESRTLSIHWGSPPYRTTGDAARAPYGGNRPTTGLSRPSRTRRALPATQGSSSRRSSSQPAGAVAGRRRSAAAYRDQAAVAYRSGPRYGTSCHSTGALNFLFFVAVPDG